MRKAVWTFWSTCLGLVALSVATARADVKPHGLFTDHMVLQQGVKVPIWGTADDGEKVTVGFRNQEVSTTAKDGKWRVDLEPVQAGGPFELTISGKNKITLKDVLVGEVWICSGQSNMQWSVKISADPEQTIANSANPNIRLYVVNREQDRAPRQDVRGSGWKVCGPQTVADFSAVGYAFGKHLHKALNVPIGLLESDLGGTAAEWWTSKATLESEPDLKTVFEDDARNETNYLRTVEKYEADVKKYLEAIAEAKARRVSLPAPPRQPFTHFHRASGLYNAMIAPLPPFAFKGVIWYQGESNAGRANQYRKLFPAMIADWRKAWGQGDFPFLFVQLAPFMKIEQEPQDTDWARLREAQLLTSMKVPNTGMAVITDVGDPNDIHPKQKEPVGARLALAARALAYGEKIVYSGPVYDSMTVEGDKAVLRFQHTGGGLLCKGSELTGFTIAGEDRKFVNAQAEIRGDTIVVTSPKVSKPAAVRYGWANCPVLNLYNKEGLPASPFRTDDFPMVTGLKKG